MNNITFSSESQLPFSKRLFRSIWLQIPSSNLAFNVGKVFARLLLSPQKQKSALKIKFENRFDFVINIGEFACNDMYLLDKHYEAQTLKLWNQLAKESSVIVDIGSQVGLFSVNAAAYNPQAKIIAVEPFPPNIPYLEQNAQLHPNIQLYKKAISTEIGECIMVLDEISGGAVVQSQKSETLLSVNVPMVTLNQLAEENNLKHIDLMKLDIEGLEDAVLNHESDFWTKTPPKNLLVEIAYDKKNPAKLQGILDSMSRRGYKYKRIQSLYAFPWKETQDLANWHFFR